MLTMSLTLVGCHSPGQDAQKTLTTPTADTAALESTPLRVDGISPNLGALAYQQLCERSVQRAQAAFAVLESRRDTATLQSVVGGMQNITYELQDINQSWYMSSVHPDAEVRQAATQCSERYTDFQTQVSLSRPYYDRLTAIDFATLNFRERFLVAENLRAYRRLGVDKDAETRTRIRSLNQEITELGNQFDKNIREDVRYVVTTTEKLAGLPDDYVEAHPANSEGNVRLSTDYPDYFPVMTYAHDDELRRQMRVANRSRGYPQNQALLQQLIEKRHELARLLDFDNFAALSMDPQMIGSPEAAADFLNKVGAALKTPVANELNTLLKRLQQIDPDATQVQAWQADYLMNLIRQEDYALDAKQVREYFSYNKVRDGIFKLTEDLFGVEIRPWQTETWHADVETYEILENGQLIGRFYMDNHPRENKYKHAAHWTLRTGIKGVQIPLSGLAQNFPQGLMEHTQVETFLHEFGHLLHNVFSGSQDWFGISGMSMERDFVEAPSQMLEEWVWDYNTLSAFATNAKGETIPRTLVEKMVNARNFGIATSTATQIFYANLSLNYYNQAPENFQLKPLMQSLQEEFAAFPYVAGTHFYANFGHLNGYSSNYYTYQWSLAIATDLFTRFKQDGLRNTKTARAYREQVLGAAGSKPARDFVADFLSREFTMDAYIEKLKSL